MSSRQPQFTTAAANKVNALRLEENNPALNLRVYITGGGCSGFQYGFTFDEAIADDDLIIEQACSDANASVKVLIDPMSYAYLSQAEIDYVSDLQGEHFVIRNPHAKTTCGCGSSFSIDNDLIEATDAQHEET